MASIFHFLLSSFTSSTNSLRHKQTDRHSEIDTLDIVSLFAKVNRDKSVGRGNEKVKVEETIMAKVKKQKLAREKCQVYVCEKGKRELATH